MVAERLSGKRYYSADPGGRWQRGLARAYTHRWYAAPIKAQVIFINSYSCTVDIKNSKQCICHCILSLIYTPVLTRIEHTRSRELFIASTWRLFDKWHIYAILLHRKFLVSVIGNHGLVLNRRSCCRIWAVNCDYEKDGIIRMRPVKSTKLSKLFESLMRLKSRDIRPVCALWERHKSWKIELIKISCACMQRQHDAHHRTWHGNQCIQETHHLSTLHWHKHAKQNRKHCVASSRTIPRDEIFELTSTFTP